MTCKETGQIKKFHILADHKRLNIYAGGGADYAMSAEFLKTRRPEAKSFLSGICEGIVVARQNRPKALEIMTKSEKGRDPAVLEYLYSLYTTEVIPARPYPKFEGVELGVEMVASTVRSAHGMKTQDLIDPRLMEELVKEARCNLILIAGFPLNRLDYASLADSPCYYFGGTADGGVPGVGTTMPGPSGISSTSVTRVT